MLAGVPLALPALTRAAKLGRRAARVGFDWPDAEQVLAKLDEEMFEKMRQEEIDEAARAEAAEKAKASKSTISAPMS